MGAVWAVFYTVGALMLVVRVLIIRPFTTIEEQQQRLWEERGSCAVL